MMVGVVMKHAAAGAFGGSERQGPRDPLWSFRLFAVQHGVPTCTDYIPLSHCIPPYGVGSQRR